MISFRETCRSSAAVPQRRATRQRGPASFVCALPGCRAWCALLWMANSCEMLLLLFHQTLLFFFFYLLLFSSSLQSRQQGLHTPKVFIQPKPRGDFHQLDKRLRLSSHDVSRPRIHQTFIVATPPARRGCVFSSHLNVFFPSYLVLSETICSFTRLLKSNERNPIQKTRLYSDDSDDLYLVNRNVIIDKQGIWID